MSNIILASHFVDALITRGDEIIDPTGRRLSISEIRAIVSMAPDQLELTANVLVDSATPSNVAQIRDAVSILAALSDKLTLVEQALAAITIRSQRVTIMSEWRSMTEDQRSEYESMSDFIAERLSL